MSRLEGPEQFGLEAYQLITELFDPESGNYRFDLDKIEPNDVFTGLLFANKVLYERLTGEEIDLFDLISIQTRLAHQYIFDRSDE